MFLWQATLEQRKLAVDLAEVIVKWECQRMKEESDDAVPQVSSISLPSIIYTGSRRAVTTTTIATITMTTATSSF